MLISTLTLLSEEGTLCTIAVLSDLKLVVWPTPDPRRTMFPFRVWALQLCVECSMQGQWDWVGAGYLPDVLHPFSSCSVNNDNVVLKFPSSTDELPISPVSCQPYTHSPPSLLSAVRTLLSLGSPVSALVWLLSGNWYLARATCALGLLWAWDIVVHTFTFDCFCPGLRGSPYRQHIGSCFAIKGPLLCVRETTPHFM